MKSHPILLLAMAVCIACSKPAGPAATAEEGAVVKWPHLKSLDELAELAESSGESGPIVDVRNLGKQIKEVAMQVAQDPLPEGAHQPGRASMLQKDLANLAQSLADPMALPEKELRSTVQGFHPVVELLMEASGMPHVHEHPDEKAKGDDKY